MPYAEPGQATATGSFAELSAFFDKHAAKQLEPEPLSQGAALGASGRESGLCQR